jgi:hypothetical protein
MRKNVRVKETGNTRNKMVIIEEQKDILISETSKTGIPIKIQVTDKPILDESPVALIISYDTAEQLFLALANALHVPRKL